MTSCQSLTLILVFNPFLGLFEFVLWEGFSPHDVISHYPIEASDQNVWPSINKLCSICGQQLQLRNHYQWKKLKCFQKIETSIKSWQLLIMEFGLLNEFLGPGNLPGKSTNSYLVLFPGRLPGPLLTKSLNLKTAR